MTGFMKGDAKEADNGIIGQYAYERVAKALQDSHVGTDSQCYKGGRIPLLCGAYRERKPLAHRLEPWVGNRGQDDEMTTYGTYTVHIETSKNHAETCN
jgi:hypothetical protein